MQGLGPLPYETLVYLGLALKIAGFAVRDELVLRGLVTSGMAADIAYFVSRPDPVLSSALANGVIVAINAALILYIVFERTTFRMGPRQAALFKSFPTLTPGHFRKLYRVASWGEATEPTRIIAQGQVVDRLFLILADSYTITKDGADFTARGPAFAGEIALLTGNLSSATVTLPAGTRFVAFPFDAIHRQMARSRAFQNSMIALFSRDLARKVALSTPIDPG